jgi:hypothetical protein
MEWNNNVIYTELVLDYFIRTLDYSTILLHSYYISWH